MDEETVRDKIRKLYKKYPLNPDKELQQWEKWITIRKEEVEHLSKALDEPPVDLTMNLLEKVRAKKEWKIAIENAQIKQKAVLRGRPWVYPDKLIQRSECEPVYEATLSKIDKGKPGIIEHVGVPHCLQVAEKCLLGEPQRKPKKKLDSEFNKYRQKRETELKEWMKKVNPFTPDTDELIIIGKKPVQIPPPLPQPIPDITFKPPFNPPVAPLMDVYAVRINNSVFYKNVPYHAMSQFRKLMSQEWHETCNSWTYYFNVPTGNVGRSTLFLHNIGTVTLRYCWKKIKRQLQYIPEDTEEQVFFFNKNEDVLPPGQFKNIKFSFVSKYPGSFKEFWEFILCNAPTFDVPDTYKLTVNLSGDTVENVDKKSGYIELLMQKIDKRAVHSMVVDVLRDVFDKATTIEPPVYPYKNFFLEAEIFVMKNPVCFYHQTEVQKLIERYSKISHGKNWDLSIATWRDVMISLPFEERMENYRFLRNCHAVLLKPWYEGDELVHQKHAAVKLMLGQLMDQFYVEYSRLCEVFEYKDKRIVRYPNPEQNELGMQGEHIRRKSTMMEEETPPVLTTHELTVKNCFYLTMHEHVAQTIEFCAGIISSLDLNRWLEFDFCQMF